MTMIRVIINKINIFILPEKLKKTTHKNFDTTQLRIQINLEILNIFNKLKSDKKK